MSVFPSTASTLLCGMIPATPVAVGQERSEQEALAVRSSGCFQKNCQPGLFKRDSALNLETIETFTER